MVIVSCFFVSNIQFLHAFELGSSLPFYGGNSFVSCIESELAKPSNIGLPDAVKNKIALRACCKLHPEESICSDKNYSEFLNQKLVDLGKAVDGGEMARVSVLLDGEPRTLSMDELSAIEQFLETIESVEVTDVSSSSNLKFVLVFSGVAYVLKRAFSGGFASIFISSSAYASDACTYNTAADLQYFLQLSRENRRVQMSRCVHLSTLFYDLFKETGKN